METPVRAFWPFTPRPPVLPLPEPMPRPTRMRLRVAPSLSRISLSFMTRSSLPRGVVRNDAHEVLDLFDHAANRGRVFQGRGPMKLVELEPDQRLALLGLAADRGSDLLDGDGLAAGSGRIGHGRLPHASAPAASPSPASRRRDCSVDT